MAIYTQSNPLSSDDEPDPFASSSTFNQEEPAHSTLSQILVLGDLLISISKDGDKLFIWSIITNELLKVMKFQSDFKASSILHPSTYLNKILIGSRNGGLKLMNVRTYQTIYDFNGEELIADGMKAVGGGSISERERIHDLLKTGNGNQITSLIQSPVIDVIAIGYSNGLIILHNLKKDETLFSVKISVGLSKSSQSISFRTDGKNHTMAVANLIGDVSIFDLDSDVPVIDEEENQEVEERRMNKGVKLTQTLRNAHIPSKNSNDEVSISLSFLPSHPLLITSSSDNSLKQWFFEGETTSTQPRLLKSRSGHSSNPILATYYGEFGREIISGGEDGEVRCLSINRESRSFEISQGSISKKASQLNLPVSQLLLPRITSISFSNTRSRDWDDVVSTHQGAVNARSWFVQNKKIGKNLLGSVNENGTKSGNGDVEATASAVSACGNFGLVGNELGSVEVYNLQSGIWRKCFDTREKRQVKNKKGKVKIVRENGKRITGIVMDETNTEVVISTSEGKLFVSI